MSETENKSELETITNKMFAKIAGALIILGYLTYGIPDGALIQPLLGTSDPLASISENTMQLTIAALIMAVNSAAVIGISLFLYPTIKQHNETIALGYIGTRIFESILMMGGIISLLLLVPLSQEYVQASSADVAVLQFLGTLAVQGNFYAYSIAMSGLAIGSLPLCYLLYQTRLVPRTISVFGLIGYPALLIMMVVEIVGSGVGPILYTLYIPGAIFELGIAVWLIVKGFNSTTIVSKNPSPIDAEPAK
ncbi:DUF4386 domain-containing protein [Haloprofundus salilacus]|uniref:DUF4386 domain-containing protein n=1 Tax=Haloprofundus salilacus TaxID=2876190 RepID=UPI001CCDD75C|nr:DUF4386 domain-containing protein [Haloprofundus salilacus]